MARTTTTRAALIEALDLFPHDFTYTDGGIICPDAPNVGAQWVMQARTALGRDPLTGKRLPHTTKEMSG